MSNITINRANHKRELREAREKRQCIERTLRHKRREKQQEKSEQFKKELLKEVSSVKKGNCEQYYNCLEKMFIENKKHCLFLYKIMIWCIFAVSQLFLVVSNIIDVVIGTMGKYYFSSILLTSLVYLYVYPENLSRIIYATIYIIDTGISKVYIRYLRTYLLDLSNLIV
jgi:hypothetical protein